MSGMRIKFNTIVFDLRIQFETIIIENETLTLKKNINT